MSTNNVTSEQDEFTTEEIDEDEILANLSPEELKQLQDEMEDLAPDLEVPVGMRQKDQTEKPATGNFDHRSLIGYLYWETESKRMTEEERVPVVLLPSQRDANHLEGEEEEEENENEEDIVENGFQDSENTPILSSDISTNGYIEKELQNYELKETVESLVNQNSNSLQNMSEDEQIKVENNKYTEENEHNIETQESSSPTPRLENILQHTKEGAEENSEEQNQNIQVEEEATNGVLPDKDKPTEAAENDVVTESPKVNAESTEKSEKVISKLSLPKKLSIEPNFIKMTARPSGNQTNLDETLAKIRKNDPAINEVNLNNIENIPKQMLIDFVNALKKNKHVKAFSIANTGADDNVAFALANMLRENKRVATLNIESNFISGKGIVAIMRCLQFNETLMELRFHNQRHMLGHHAEMEIARLLKANTTLLKLGYHFEVAGPRMVVTNLLTRNLDKQRQKRLEEQKQQQMKEHMQIISMLQNGTCLPPELWAVLEDIMPDKEKNKAAEAASPPLPQTTDNNPFLPEEVIPPPESFRDVKLKKTKLKLRGQMKTADDSDMTVHGHEDNESSQSVSIKDVKLKKTKAKWKEQKYTVDDNYYSNQFSENQPFSIKQIQLKRAKPKPKQQKEEDDKPDLKAMIRTLKPVPRRRQPPLVELTPRDQLLQDIRQSNIAYLKSVPVPKQLE
ncbi:leiomodin-3 [Protopterus annectens]|uniref:leiomodin-3 n=1 Tax=Protopterus annectens TaxID=7888 RepID=UPI001CFB33B3|nr:leiomodin-3 [Protopterus annectens]